MRAFAKGEEFMDVGAEKGGAPTFSESFLYSVMSKDDARFILGVAKKYTHLIHLLGTETIKNLLTLDRARGKVPPSVIQTIVSELQALCPHPRPYYGHEQYGCTYCEAHIEEM